MRFALVLLAAGAATFMVACVGSPREGDVFVGEGEGEGEGVSCSESFSASGAECGSQFDCSDGQDLSVSCVESSTTGIFDCECFENGFAFDGNTFRGEYCRGTESERIADANTACGWTI